MNTTYKILWIDDSEDFFDSTEELIMDTVRANNMVPEIKYYVHYEAFLESEIEGFDAEIFNQYDQLIIDYALSGITGDEIIRGLRERHIYTDVVFYSSEYQKMQDEMRGTNQLDGVFFADRNDLTVIVDRVIKKNLRREYNIANVRGLIMDNSSEFDYICRITAVALFDLLNPEKQAEIEEIAKGFVGSAQQQSTQNFDDLKKKKGRTYVKKAIESVEYVMSNKDRYSLMALILREFDFSEYVPSDLAEQYASDVITPRNQLAHSKLFYGECKKKLHIAKTRQRLKCNEDCEHCTSKYSIESCEHLRKRLFEYYELFQQIDQDVSKYLAESLQPI